MIIKFEKFLNEDWSWDDDDHWWGEDDWYWSQNDEQEKTNPISKMLLKVNFEKLSMIGLIEYQDIVENCIEYFEKQITSGTYGKNIIPSLDTIQDYIISMIGIDYKGYISDDKLDNLSRFIYQEIDNYIYD